MKKRGPQVPHDAAQPRDPAAGHRDDEQHPQHLAGSAAIRLVVQPDSQHKRQRHLAVLGHPIVVATEMRVQLGKRQRQAAGDTHGEQNPKVRIGRDNGHQTTQAEGAEDLGNLEPDVFGTVIPEQRGQA